MEQIKNLVETLEILKKAVAERNQVKSFETASIFLHQFKGTFGHRKVVQDTFPTLEELKHHITAGDYNTASAQVQALLAMLRSVMLTTGALPIDVSFRPQSYFRPLGLEGQVLMGGESLPAGQADEVEIARIELKSATRDVVSVYATRVPSGIRYRVVDDHAGETLTGDRERESAGPLSLGELVDFFVGGWPLMEVLEFNVGKDVEQMLDLFSAASNFYPDFDRVLRQRVVTIYLGSYSWT